MTKFHQISLAVAITCLAVLPLKAQTSQGILSGVARDTTGAVLAKATGHHHQ